MKTLAWFLFVLSAPFALQTAHADGGSDFSNLLYDPAPVAHADPTEHAPFGALTQELQYLIHKRGDTSATNHFCVVGYRFGSGDLEAVVIWAERRQLIRWAGHRNPELASEGFAYANSLFFSKALDLDTDLVDTREEAGLSTFLTVRSQAEAVIADCDSNGRHYAIESFTPPPEAESQ